MMVIDVTRFDERSWFGQARGQIAMLRFMCLVLATAAIMVALPAPTAGQAPTPSVSTWDPLGRSEGGVPRGACYLLPAPESMT